MQVCWLADCLVRSFAMLVEISRNEKPDLHEISLLNFERSRSKFKVKTAVLENRQIVLVGLMSRSAVCLT